MLCDNYEITKKYYIKQWGTISQTTEELKARMINAKVAASRSILLTNKLKQFNITS